MKMTMQTAALLALSAGQLLTLSACSSQGSGQGASTGPAQTDGRSQGTATVSIRPGEPGGEATQTYQETATVVSIDKGDRRITVLDPGGTERTFKVGPEVANFDQIEPGDRVKATVTQQLAIFMRGSNEPLTQQQSTTFAVPPVGSKPGIMMKDTVEMIAKVTAIDPQNRQASVQFPDGRTQTFKVRSDVDLSRRRVGENVIIRSTEATAIRVEKP